MNIPFRKITTRSILGIFEATITKLIKHADAETAKAQTLGDTACKLREKQRACLAEADEARSAVDRLKVLVGGV
jgi:hypothetical protein